MSLGLTLFNSLKESKELENIIPLEYSKVVADLADVSDCQQLEKLMGEITLFDIIDKYKDSESSLVFQKKRMRDIYHRLLRLEAVPGICNFI